MTDIRNSNPYRNYCGKSTYLKQVATIVFLAQIGSFVPASFARLGLVDKSESNRYDQGSSQLVQQLNMAVALPFSFQSSHPCPSPRNGWKNAKLFHGRSLSSQSRTSQLNSEVSHSSRRIWERN